MRLSVLKGDPGYCGSIAPQVKVFFNGYERRCVFTADEEQRMIVAAVLDERGAVRQNKAKDDIEKETLYGDVRIELPEGVKLPRIAAMPCPKR